MAEPFDCARDCQRTDGAWDSAKRSARGCKLIGAPSVPFEPTRDGLYNPPRGSAYMGKHPHRGLDGTRHLGALVIWQAPIEVSSMGCPGAYYRSAFINSIYPYMRRRMDGGGRVQNPMFDSAHWRIQQAVMYFEGEQERCYAYVAGVQHERALARSNKPK